MKRTDAMQGSIDLLVMKILARQGPLHGYGITSRIQAMSDNVLRVEEGSLYPALHRMEESGWIKAEWKVTDNRRRARLYELTPAGVKQLADAEERWTNITAAVARVLRLA